MKLVLAAAFALAAFPASAAVHTFDEATLGDFGEIPWYLTGVTLQPGDTIEMIGRLDSPDDEDVVQFSTSPSVPTSKLNRWVFPSYAMTYYDATAGEAYVSGGTTQYSITGPYDIFLLGVGSRAWTSPIAYMATMTFSEDAASIVPLPAGVWLLGSVLAGLGMWRRRRH